MPEVDFDTNVTDLYDAIVKSDWATATAAVRQNPVEAATWVVRRDPERRNGDDGDDGDAGRAPAAGDILWRSLPLHSACARRPPPGFLRDLLAAFPHAASLADEAGMFPLHYACGNRACLFAIAQLVTGFPQAVRARDPQGMLPLHYLAQWGPSEDGTVELLLKEYADGAAVRNGEGMSPLDLCRDRNFEEWEAVSGVIERLGNYTIEVPRKEDSLVSSLQSTHTDGKRPNKEHSRTGNEISVSSSTRSRKSPSRHSGTATDEADDCIMEARDEISTQRSRRQSRSCAATCPLPTSPRYHQMKTPRSSGSGRGLQLGQKTPTSSGRGREGFHFGQQTPTSSGRSGEGFNFGQTTPTSVATSLVIDVDNESLDKVEEVRSHTLANHFSQEDETRKQARRQAMDHLSQEKEKEARQQTETHPPQDKEDAKYQAALLRAENTKLRAGYKRLRTENLELRGRSAHYATVQEENERLRADLAIGDAENAELRRQLSRLQDARSRLDAADDVAKRREHAYVRASSARRKMLLEMLAAEEKPFAHAGRAMGEDAWTEREH